jgi:hypothetical protein
MTALPWHLEFRVIISHRYFGLNFPVTPLNKKLGIEVVPLIGATHQVASRMDLCLGAEILLCVKTTMIHGMIADCKSSREWHAQLDHNRRTWDPNIICDSCKRQGHSTTNCDMRAMALFLEKYVKVSTTPTPCNRIEAAWLQR